MAADQLTVVELARSLGLRTPTEEQAAVAEYPPTMDVGGEQCAAPLLVVAGAGSGKTETLSLRATYLAHRYGYDGQDILGLTFTRKAAAELSERLRQRLESLHKTGTDGKASDPFSFLLNSPEATTYNAFALNVVQEFGATVGISPSVEHMGEAAAWQLMSEVVAAWPHRIRGDSAESTVVEKALSLREDIANQAMDVDEARRALDRLKGTFERSRQQKKRSFTVPFQEGLERLEQRFDLLDIIERFEKQKMDSGRMDYADQVLAAIKIVENSERARATLRARHKIVFLDEFQDTSVAQMRFLSALFQDHPVTAVGDPNQAIYGWRGASAASLLDFHPLFTRKPGVPKTVKGLTTAWRSSKNVLDIANTLAKPLDTDWGENTSLRLKPRPGAPDGEVTATYPYKETESQRQIVDAIIDLRVAHERAGLKAPSIAVLARTTRPLLPIVEALREASVPAQLVGGDSLLQHPRVVDLRSTLEITADVGKSTSLMRLLTNLDLGAADIQALANYSHRMVGGRGSQASSPAILLEAVESAASGEPVPGLSKVGTQRVAHLGQKLRKLRAAPTTTLTAQVERARQQMNLDVEGLADPTSEDVTGVLDLFTDVATDYQNTAERPTMAGFLTWLDAAEQKEGGIRVPSVNIDPNAVQVLTIHASKGLEWDAVVLAEMRSGRFPSYRANAFTRGKTNDDPILPPESPYPQFGWWKDSGVLPYPCRRDRQHLPDPPIWDGEEGGGKRIDLLKEEIGAYLEDEERRLAYVAVTRAKTSLFMTGSWFDTGRQARYPSIFFRESLAVEQDSAPTVEALTTAPPPPSTWPEMREMPERVPFPREPGSVRRRAHQASQRIKEETSAAAKLPERRRRDETLQTLGDRELARAIRLLLNQKDRDALEAEENANRNPEQVLALAAESRVLTVTELASFAANPDRGIDELLRPIPSEPSTHAVIGNAFHQWVEQKLAKLSVTGADLDPDEPPSEIFLDSDAKNQFRKLTDAFSRAQDSEEWKQRTEGWSVEGIEVPFLLQIGNKTARGRIDVAFKEPNGKVHLVDWKTRSRNPKKIRRETVRAYQKQLELYLAAWKERAGNKARIDAHIVFVSPQGLSSVSYEQLVAAAEADRDINLD